MMNNNYFEKYIIIHNLNSYKKYLDNKYFR